MKDKNAEALGKKGGEATKRIYGNDYFKELSKKGVEARKAKKVEAILPIDNQPLDSL